MLIIFAQILCAANEHPKCSTLTRATFERYAQRASGSRARKRTLTRAGSKAKSIFISWAIPATITHFFSFTIGGYAKAKKNAFLGGFCPQDFDISPINPRATPKNHKISCLYPLFIARNPSFWVVRL